MRNHRITIGVVCVVLAMLAVGCRKVPKPNQGQGQGQQQELPKGPYFKFTLGFPEELVLNLDSGAQSWTVETDITDWTAESDAEWCKPTAKPDQLWLDIEDYEVRYEDGPYKGNIIYAPPRSCTVTVKAGTVFNRSFKIVQQTHLRIAFPEAVANVLTVELPADGGSREVTVDTNAYQWAATTEASWLKVERKDGATLKVTSTARPDSETAARSATVKVYVTSDEFNSSSFTVKDAPAYVDGDGFDYGEHTDWD